MTLSAYDAAVLSESPLVYLPLDEPSGTTATDISGHGRHGTATGAVTRGADGPLGSSSTEFGGGVITIPYGSWANTTGTWTALVWVRTTASPSNVEVLMGRENQAGSQVWNLNVRPSSGVGGYHRNNDYRIIATTGTLTLGDWHLVGYTVGATAATLYLDGVQIGTSSADGTTRSETSIPLTIGAGVGGVAAFAGRLARAALIPAALTSARHAALYAIAGAAFAPASLDLSIHPAPAALEFPRLLVAPQPVELRGTITGTRVLSPLRPSPAPLDLALDLAPASWEQALWAVSGLPLGLSVGQASASWPNLPMEPGPLDLGLGVGAGRAGIATRPGVYPTPDDAPGWTGRVVTMTGEAVAELPHVLDVRLTEELNSATSASFVVPKYAPGAEEIRSLGTEIQLWRNDDLMCWGPVVARGASSGSGAMSALVRDPWWYIQRRFFGAPNRRNLIRNGGFEEAGRWVHRRCTFTRTGARAFEGAMSARLDCPTPGLEAYLVQQFTPPALDGTHRNTVTVSAWVWIDPGMWSGPAANSAGLRLAIGGPRPRSSIATIDDGTDRGQWVQLTARLAYSAADQSAPMTVRLYAPAGRVWWDAVVAARPENTSTGPDPGLDQATFAARIVRYAQTGRGKSPVHIGTVTPPTGVARVRRWLHADHDPIEDAITELVEAEDGIDWSMDLTPTTRTWRTHHPWRGRDLTGGDDPVVLRLGSPTDGGTVASYDWDEDGTRVATSVIALGPGAGTTRAEGGAVDTGDLDGLILERVTAAPDGMAIRDLDPWARADLDVAGRLDQTLTITSHPADQTPEVASRLIHDVHCGDVVTVQIDDGPVQIDGPHRVLRRDIAGRPETITFTVTAWS